MSASSSMTRSSRRRRRARRGKVFLRTTSQSRLRLDSSPSRGALGRPGQPYCSLGPDGAQSSGPCSHWKRHCIAAVNLNSGARLFPIAKNFARSARPLPTRQWLPYQGSWHREAMTERLYPMPRFRSVSRLLAGDPSYNLSVTFGDTSPCRRGLGIPQTSPSRQWLPYQGSWHREAMTERLYYMPLHVFRALPSREWGRSGSSNRSGGSSSAITCSSARCWASWRRRAACSLARNSSKYSAL